MEVVGVFFVLMWIFMIMVCIGLIAFWIWALVDCINNMEGNDRLLWVLIIVFVHALGALLYVLIGRQSRWAR